MGRVIRFHGPPKRGAAAPAVTSCGGKLSRAVNSQILTTKTERSATDHWISPGAAATSAIRHLAKGGRL